MPGDRLLIIDDEPEISKIVATVAERIGYEVVSADSADEFRSRCVDWNPTLIVMDLQMPGTDGVELIRFLASVNSAAKILVMSGFDARVLESARRLGVERGLNMAGTLGKPVRVANLQKILTALKTEGGTPNES